jgi:hypothetical protein
MLLAASAAAGAGPAAAGARPEARGAPGDKRENNDLETTLVADLPFPVDASRPECATG